MFRDGGIVKKSEFASESIFEVESGGAVFAKPKYSDYIEAVYKVVNIKRDIFDSLYL